jgi:hypothetical protein
MPQSKMINEEQSQARFLRMRQAVTGPFKTPSLRPLRVLGGLSVKIFLAMAQSRKSKEYTKSSVF